MKVALFIVICFLCFGTGTHKENTFGCSLLGKNSFLMVRRSTNQSKMALRFYNGKTADTSIETPINNGADIVDIPGFDVSKNTLIYIPGYKENVLVESVRLIINSFLKRGDTNVIVVDWSGYSTNDYFTAIIACVTKVPVIAAVIKEMSKRGVPLEKFHVMGHSLGAQCAGYVGKRFTEKKLKIITGLDPAGPVIGASCTSSLRSGDAEFVHIIQTDRGLYGTSNSCGDFNVIFNSNGYRQQPGCPCIILPLTFTFEEACSHHRSWRYYAESISGDTEFYCAVCNSYKDFLSGNCGNQTLQAAYGAPHRSRGKCYIETNAGMPYGRGLAGARHT